MQIGGAQSFVVGVTTLFFKTTIHGIKTLKTALTKFLCPFKWLKMISLNLV